MNDMANINDYTDHTNNLGFSVIMVFVDVSENVFLDHSV